MNTIFLTMPIPPSVNRSFGNRQKGAKGRGRYVTKALASWRQAAGTEVKTQLSRVPLHNLNGVVEVFISASMAGPRASRRDGDNLLKAILDLLVSLRVIEDDSARYVRKVGMEWVDGGEAGRCEVRVVRLSLGTTLDGRGLTASQGNGCGELPLTPESVSASTGKRRGSQCLLKTKSNARTGERERAHRMLKLRGIDVSIERVHVN